MPRIPCPSEAWDRYYADMDASEVADINYGVLQRVYELSRNHGGRRRGPGREVNWTGKDSDLYPEGEWWVADVNVSAEDTMVVTVHGAKGFGYPTELHGDAAHALVSDAAGECGCADADGWDFGIELECTVVLEPDVWDLPDDEMKENLAVRAFDAARLECSDVQDNWKSVHEALDRLFEESE
jgi:hypothetical protein